MLEVRIRKLSVMTEIAKKKKGKSNAFLLACRQPAADYVLRYLLKL
jgi:hypothetical protein